jgi:hypothetical protein
MAREVNLQPGWLQRDVQKASKRVDEWASKADQDMSASDSKLIRGDSVKSSSSDTKKNAD